MEAVWPLAVGGRLVIEGETVFVNGVDGAEVRGFTAAGAPVRLVLTRVAGEESAVASGEEWRFGSVLVDAGALSSSQLREAAELLGMPSRLAAALQRLGHLAENYLLDSIDPPIATRVLAHTSAHTGVDIPSLTTPPSGSDAPPAVHHARLLAARLMGRTALVSWHTPASAHPATAHHERMRDLARAILGYAAKLLTSAHGPNMTRHASIAVCREHTEPHQPRDRPDPQRQPRPPDDRARHRRAPPLQ